jgi:hypothetical protein
MLRSYYTENSISKFIIINNKLLLTQKEQKQLNDIQTNINMALLIFYNNSNSNLCSNIMEYKYLIKKRLSPNIKHTLRNNNIDIIERKKYCGLVIHNELYLDRIWKQFCKIPKKDIEINVNTNPITIKQPSIITNDYKEKLDYYQYSSNRLKKC